MHGDTHSARTKAVPVPNLVLELLRNLRSSGSPPSVMKTLHKCAGVGIPGNLDGDTYFLLKIFLADDCGLLRRPRLVRNTVEFDNRPAAEFNLLQHGEDGR
jgi:hypothetical protein